MAEKFTVPSKFTIPSTIEGVMGLLTARKWEKAAIVYAYTKPPKEGRPETGGKPPVTTVGTIQFPCSYSDFASLGIAGLRDRHAVALYRERWSEAMKKRKAKAVKPGETISVPDLPWPPTDHDKRSGTNRHVSDKMVVDRLREKPELISEAITSDQDKLAEVASATIQKRGKDRIAAKAKERGVEQDTVSDKDWKERWAKVGERFAGALEELGRKDLIQEYLACATAVTEYAAAIEKFGVIGISNEQAQIEKANSLLSGAIWTTESVLKKNISKKS